MNHIEEAYRKYIRMCFEETLPEKRDDQIRRAFFIGVGWLKETLENMVDEDEAMEFLSDIYKEFDQFLETLDKKSLNQ